MTHDPKDKHDGDRGNGGGGGNKPPVPPGHVKHPKPVHGPVRRLAE